MASRRTALPPLAFGGDVAIAHSSEREFTDLIDRAIPGMNAYESLVGRDAFRSRTAALRMPQVTVVAAAISPTLVDRRGNADLTFLLPYAGTDPSACRVGHGDAVSWGLGLGGILLPRTDEKVVGSGGFRSQVMWNLQPERLEQTARGMVGSDTSPDLRTDRLRLLPQQVAGAPTEALVQGLLPLLQVCRRKPGVLAGLGVEDLFYRLSVMLLRPDLFEQPPAAAAGDAGSRRRCLGPLCEYIVAHLSDTITLSTLERFSGLSARTLQLAFREVHGCSPMSWVREQRLQRVRRGLLGARHETVEALARAAGFQAMPPFFLAYRRRFGETPGQTRHRGGLGDGVESTARSG